MRAAVLKSRGRDEGPKAEVKIGLQKGTDGKYRVSERCLPDLSALLTLKNCSESTFSEPQVTAPLSPSAVSASNDASSFRSSSSSKSTQFSPTAQRLEELRLEALSSHDAGVAADPFFFPASTLVQRPTKRAKFAASSPSLDTLE